MPSAAIREAFFWAEARPFFRRTTMAASISPFDSVRAFLQSIMPAPVFSRSSFTSFALTSMIGSFRGRKIATDGTDGTDFHPFHPFNPWLLLLILLHHCGFVRSLYGLFVGRNVCAFGFGRPAERRHHVFVFRSTAFGSRLGCSSRILVHGLAFDHGL